MHDVRLLALTRRHPSAILLVVQLAGLLLYPLQAAFDLPGLLPWSAGLEALFYFYAAGSLIAYMMGDQHATTDELFAAGA
ncbi:MAG: two pore domain potassium channel family protein, partial [Burkholderiaceae bacterium]|nr:two pore domain potassium channel family protein [Burkholderiaceae bacterium]